MLYIIPTPIWNLDDITIRWAKLLQSLNYLICEDTRSTKKLLQKLSIPYDDKKFFSLTSFTHEGKLAYYTELLQENDIWLVSDAWTPGLSDPGKTLIKICHENDLSFSILPGANALVPAIVSAWFDTSKFTYLGFLPAKKWRQTAINAIIERKHATFIYESVHRIHKTLKQLSTLWFIGHVSISREISKMFETHKTYTLQYLINNPDTIKLKGEFVVWLFPTSNKKK